MIMEQEMSYAIAEAVGIGGAAGFLYSKYRSRVKGFQHGFYCAINSFRSHLEKKGTISLTSQDQQTGTTLERDLDDAFREFIEKIPRDKKGNPRYETCSSYPSSIL